MGWPGWQWILTHVIRRRTALDDLDEEINVHLAIDLEERIAGGESPAAARLAARREFGNELRVREITRDVWGLTSVERLWQDLRYSARALRQSPGFAVLACTALALGIGATTAIYTVVQSVLLRPLPFRDPSRLVMLWERQPNTGRPNVVAMTNFRDWQRDNRSFEAMAAIRRTPMNLLGDSEAVQVTGAAVTADFFTVLAVPPLLGRTFRPDEDRPHSPPVVVLTYGFWVRRFGARPDIIGRRISVNATHHEVIGVMPAGFSFPDTRVQAFAVLRGWQEDGRNYSVIARLRSSATLTNAREEMAALAAETARARPALNANWSATVVPLHEQMVGDVRRPLIVLLAAVGCLLLIACANVANLLLMRATARAQEFAVRHALGAGRLRLVHQMLVESLVLALGGAVPGIGVAWVSIHAFVRLAPAALGLPRLDEVSIDLPVLLFATAVAVVTALLFGVVPALAGTRIDPQCPIAKSSRSIASGHRRWQSLIVIAEVALALPLLVGTGLVAYSFFRLHQVDPGFRAEGVLTVRMLLLPVRDRVLHADLVSDILARVRTLPGVIAAGTIGRLPMDGGNSGSWYYRADRPEPPAGRRPGGDISIISPGYFAAMGIRMVNGRDFDDGDRLGAPHVAILNQTAAKAFLGDEDPIGRRFRVWWNDAREVEIVGVVSDIRHGQLQAPPDPCLFMPHAQQPFPFSALVVRSAAHPRTLIEPVKAVIRSVDPDQGVGEIQSLEELMSDAVALPRTHAVLFAAFGATALALTCIGLYAVLSYAVSHRAREIGLRLALGATPRGTLASILGGGLRHTAIGLAIGLGLAMWLSRFMQGLLFEVKAIDATVYGSVTILMALVAAAACAAPAIRAIRIDPAIVLRTE